jgi:hypothetical protein
MVYQNLEQPGLQYSIAPFNAERAHSRHKLDEFLVLLPMLHCKDLDSEHCLDNVKEIVHGVFGIRLLVLVLAFSRLLRCRNVQGHIRENLLWYFLQFC